VVRDRREEVVHDVAARVVLHALEKPVAAIDRRQRAAQQRPRVAAIPRQARVGVVQIGHERDPRDEHDVRPEIPAHHRPRPRDQRCRGEHERDDRAQRHAERDLASLARPEERARRPEVRAASRRRAPCEVEREHQQRQPKAQQAHRPGQRLDLGCGERMPALVALDVADVTVMQPVADPPGVVRHEERRVQQVSDDVIRAPRAHERSVAAVVSEDEECPQHGSLREPEERRTPRGCAPGERVEHREDDQISRQGQERARCRRHQAARGNCGAERPPVRRRLNRTSSDESLARHGP